MRSKTSRTYHILPHLPIFKRLHFIERLVEVCVVFCVKFTEMLWHATKSHQRQSFPGVSNGFDI